MISSGWIAVLILALLSGAALGLRTLIQASVTKAVDAKFEKELESLRSDLRMKEAKITALQSTVLTGQTNWQSTLDQRRITAIEELWAATMRLDKFKIATTLLTMLKLDTLEKRAKNDPKVRQFIETLSGGGIDELPQTIGKIGGESERLFVPPAVWKIFDAYRGLLTFSYLRLKIISTGIGETEKMFDPSKVVSAIKEIMPNAADYLEKFGIVGAAHLADPLRELLFDSLKATLAGGEAAEDNITRVVEMTAKLDAQLAKQLRGGTATDVAV